MPQQPRQFAPMHFQSLPSTLWREWLFAFSVTLFGVSPFEERMHADADESTGTSIRIATYNVSLYANGGGEVAERLSDGVDEQAEKLARVIQTVRPDILLLNEVDYDDDGSVINLFADQFLARPHGTRDAIDFPHRYWAPSNTGVDSGLDIDGNGIRGQLADDWGFGNYEGQYALAVLSRFPIDTNHLRSFQFFKWSDLPGALKPVDPKSGKPYFSDDVWSKLRLSSKNHVDVPININGRTLHLLVSHPTPPVFDGREDRNGCRNHDEIRFWSLYVTPEQSVRFRDDQGRLGGLSEDESFVIAGDLNSDPIHGDSRHEAIIELISHPRTRDPMPSRSKNKSETQTACFGGQREYRIDYVLPSKELSIKDSGVYWPRPANIEANTGANAEVDAETNTDRVKTNEVIDATDHRIVWIEVVFP